MNEPTADFDAQFAPFLAALNDTDARFFGEGMVSDLLALEPLAETDSQKARLYRELSVLQGKRYESACLDYAAKALAAQATSGILTDDRLFSMHVLCGDHATAWGPTDAAKSHLDAALDLHKRMGKPIEAGFSLRLNKGVVARTTDGYQAALDLWQPLLADAEPHYGADSQDLCHLINLIAESHAALGQYTDAIALQTRSAALRLAAENHGSYVSATSQLAQFQARAGQHGAAKATHRAAIDHAKSHSPSSAEYAKGDYNAAYSLFGTYKNPPYDH